MLPTHWRPWLREAELAQTSLAEGLRLLRKARFASPGIFSQSFFNLSIGLERTMKLIYLIDYGLKNGGALPTKKFMQTTVRHDLLLLHTEMQRVTDELVAAGLEFEFRIPDPALVQRILGVLNEFAQQTRYYNLDLLSKDSTPGRDPLDAWAADVGRYVLKHHPKPNASLDKQAARRLDDDLSGKALVRHTDLDGSRIESIRALFLAGARDEWVQAQPTFHGATLARHLHIILYELCSRCRPGSVLELPDLWEGSACFYNDDKYLRGRKTFTV